MRAGVALLFGLVLAGCVSTAPAPVFLPAEPLGVENSPRDAARTFVTVVQNVAPVAEQLCREQTRGMSCTFRIAIDDTPGQPPNAFQTLDEQGNPVLAFNLALLATVRNPDELAFVMGHEAAHHIAGHLGRQRESSLAGALVAGTLASLGGADEAAIREAQSIGAQMGARTFSKEFELEADALGTEIAWLAGFDPVLGAQFFNRLPDPGNRFLGTHPPNAERQAVVRRTLQALAY